MVTLEEADGVLDLPAQAVHGDTRVFHHHLILLLQRLDDALPWLGTKAAKRIEQRLPSEVHAADQHQLAIRPDHHGGSGMPDIEQEKSGPVENLGLREFEGIKDRNGSELHTAECLAGTRECHPDLLHLRPWQTTDEILVTWGLPPACLDIAPGDPVAVEDKGAAVLVKQRHPVQPQSVAQNIHRGVRLLDIRRSDSGLETLTTQVFAEPPMSLKSALSWSERLSASVAGVERTCEPKWVKARRSGPRLCRTTDLNA